MKNSVYTILGATGFIGGNLIRHLRGQGHDVLAPERDSPTPLNRFLGHVLYCIGFKTDFRNRPFETVDAHIGRLREILEDGHFRSLIYLSSTRVYRRASSTDEDTALVLRPDDPDDVYNASKVMGETLCLNSNREGTRVVRLSNVYGPDLRSETFLNAVVRDALRKKRIVLHTAPDSAKDYVGIDDVAAMLPRIAEEGKARIYNLASGRNTVQRDLTDALARVTGCDVRYEPDAPKVEFPEVSIARLRREFGFAPADVTTRLDWLVQQFRDKLETAPAEAGTGNRKRK
ncbi:MAG: NAD(P)-dependent oxidoreductase [Alphaproteobacteria bacterium]